ncbi:MAG: rod shape-determining protein MreC [Faecalibacterium sp.]|nr:rod shape-determining protein MreC [Ruminococcus sp.]MCM1393118.1 rod shape-determining protein MreC [Ruminococcus sp.]MCM1486509.1 rod shape-determining protein MreC [Faecalibacterium sp.]
MRRFIKSIQFRVFVFVLCALLVGTIIAVATENSVSPASAVVGTVFSPLQKVTGKISEKLSWFSSSFASAGTYKNENDRLKEKIAEYENQLADYNEIKHKISSYETMLGVKQDNPDFELEPANIIGTDAADAFSSLIIDKGSGDGVSVNDPVVYGNYLVGVVRKVNESYSIVETILNPAVNISAIESKTRETAYVTTNTAQSSAGKCILAGLERSTSVSPGGIVMTSGIGGIYPKGLIIGTVSQVCQSEYDISSYAVINPGADVNSVEDVFIITSFKGQGIEEIAGN